MNLAEMCARLHSGRATVEALQSEIRSFADLYSFEPPDDFGELDTWMERRWQLERALNELADGLWEETDWRLLHDKGYLLTTAAALLDDTNALSANVFVASRLIDFGQYGSALHFLDMAESSHDRLPDKKGAISGKIFVGKMFCLEKLNAFAAMEGCAKKALPLLEDPDSRPQRVAVLLAYINALRHRSKFDEAVAAAREGLQLTETIPAPDHKTRSELAEDRLWLSFQLGEAARLCGNFEEAQAAYAAARQQAQALGDASRAATALSELGITWFRMGEHQRAWEILNDAAREAEQIGRHKDAARWRGHMNSQEAPAENDSLIEILTYVAALLRRQPPQPQEARRLALRCIARAKQEKNKMIEAEARNCLAHSYSLEGKYAQAIPAFRAAVRLAVKLADKRNEIIFRTNLAMILTEARYLRDAENELSQAIELGRQMRDGAPTTEARQAITAGLENTYDTLAILIANRYEKPDGGAATPSRADRLIELAQESRASNFAAWVGAEMQIEARGQMDLRRLLRELRAVETGLEMMALDGTPDLTRLFDRQRNLRQELLCAASINSASINLAPPIFTAEQLCRVLRPDQCLVDLYAPSRQVIITLLAPDGQLQTRLCKWTKEERRRLLEGWQAEIFSRRGAGREERRFHDTAEAPWLRLAAPAEDTIEKIALPVLLAELQDKFMTTLGELLSEQPALQHLIVVPHRELALIPYWLLAEQFPALRVSVMPGANIFKLLTDHPRRPVGPRLALGDATNTLTHVPAELGCLPDFDLLPYDIHQALARIGGANMLHIAGHGQFDRRNPYRSGLIVQKGPADPALPYGAQTLYNEELLTVAEVLAEVALPNCYLTVLSACCSGLPRQHPASEFVGLPSAFLIAGARNVIASLWPVNDGATCVMMQEFYAALFGEEGTTVSQALALARERLRRMPRQEVITRLGPQARIPEKDYPFSDPEYVLPFQHFGVN